MAQPNGLWVFSALLFLYQTVVGNLKKMRCLWCNLETTTEQSVSDEEIKYANKEHIFPEAVGGIKCLEVGKVCQDCNKRLGDNVDRFLKTENFMMLKQYQDSSEIIGKPIGKIRGKSDRERKTKEITNLSGYGGGFQIKRNQEESNIITLTNLPDGSGGDFTYNEKFSKALHKCAINVLLDKYDYEFTKSNFKELIDFINDSNNQEYQNWSYSVCYSNLFSKVHFEPFCLQIIEIEKIPKAIVLIFPCAIFIVCTKPNLLNTNLLNIISSNLPKLKNWEQEGFDYLKHFTSVFESSRKSYGDSLKFTLIKKEIKGSPNPNDSFYLLVKCKTCGQTNPTGIMLNKESILNGNQNHTIGGGNRNTWNKLSIKDLAKKGLIVENWSEKSLQQQIDQGVSYPVENDVKKMNISDCRIQCINCNDTIIYDAKDCFV